MTLFSENHSETRTKYIEYLFSKNDTTFMTEIEDPITHPELIEPYLPHDDNAFVHLFELAASSFRVALKIPGATFFIPNKEEIMKKEKELKESRIQKIPKKPNNNFFIPLPRPEPFETVPLPNPKETQKQLKPKEDSNTTPSSQVLKPNLFQASQKPKLEVTGLPDDPSTYPPPIPDDNDPVRNRMLHAWYWAGYYTALYDAQMKEQAKK